jgi:hypothetical protein
MNANRAVEERREEAHWLRSLRDLAQEWLKANDGLTGWVEKRARKRPTERIPVSVPSNAYVDLIFAFGLARLGEQAPSLVLLEQAGRILDESGDAVHAFVFRAFTFRIAEALAGKPHMGLLTLELLEERQRLEPMRRYTIDRLRMHLRILEPDQEIDPYGPWVARVDEIHRQLKSLVDLADVHEFASCIRDLLNEARTGPKREVTQAEILLPALNACRRLGEEFTHAMLDHALSTFDALVGTEVPLPRKGLSPLYYAAKLLEKSLAAWTFLADRMYQDALMNRVRKMLERVEELGKISPIRGMTAQCFRALRLFGLQDEMQNLLARLPAIALRGKDVADFIQNINFTQHSDDVGPLCLLAQVATGWLSLGHAEEADRLLESIRSVLFRAEFGFLEQSLLAREYIAAVSQFSAPKARGVLEEVFRALKRVDDSFTTQSHFKATMLQVIECAVLSVLERTRPLLVFR